MRKVVLIGLAGLTLIAGSLDAEARGFRLRIGGLRTRSPAIRTVPRETVSTPGLAVRPEVGVGARPTYVVLPGPNASPEPSAARAVVEGAAVAGATVPASAPPAAVKAVAEAQPWCRSQRIVGSGAGFCLIN